ncbi:MAG: PEP-CTERM sorting domain-containing protein [Pirellulales bacterium]|nr:PEP-CTERM sorting domain-containing protein [Pirellulales bacterium]
MNGALLKLSRGETNRGAKVLAAVLVCFSASDAFAALIPIANASFESPSGPFGSGGGPQPDNWTLVQGAGGVWNINDFPEGFWNVPAPDGKQVLSVIGPPFAAVSLYRQTLDATFAANTIYTLRGQTGAPLGNGQYIVSLLAANNYVTSANGTAPDNVFGPFSLLIDTNLHPGIVGQQIGIELRGNVRYTAFDALELQAEYIPEPGTLPLAALGLIVLRTRRRIGR